MIVSDDALARSYLNKIGYYRLSGYSYPYRKSSESGGKRVVEDQFRDGTKFSEIVDLYVFDKRLRLLMMDVIERIEIALRVQVTLALGQRGPDAHRDKGALHPNFVNRLANANTTETRHQEWLRRQDDAFLRSKEEFAKHFKNKYVAEDPPLWIAAELWDFGTLSMLYSGLRVQDQLAVASFFNVPTFQIMETWLRALNVARNICAHHSRLWNRASVVQPKWPSSSQCADLGHIAGNTAAQTRLYGLACICAELLKSINPTSKWRERFIDTAKAFPTSVIVSLDSAGFPKEWGKANIWA
jgi:abortive infection bacteriophage resistance protein